MRFYHVKCNVFHLVSNTRGQYWKASPRFPVGTVNIVALQSCVLQELKKEFENAS